MKLSDIFDVVYFILKIYKIRNIYFRTRNLAVARFIVFHDIPLGIKEQFENNIRLLKKHTNIISLHEFMSGNMNIHAINTVITFDDGYKSWVDIVLPVLKKYAIKATFFISSGFIRESKRISPKFNINELSARLIPHKSQPYITAEDIVRIKNANQIIGGHTLNHISLLKEKDYSFIHREISEDKKILEEIVGTKIIYFAYPFGHVNYGQEIRKILITNGYDAAVTLNPGFNSRRNDVYQLHRDIVHGGMNSVSFLATCLGKKDVSLFIRNFIYKNLLKKR